MRRDLIILFLLILLLVLLKATGAHAASPKQAPGITISAPASASVGQTISVTVMPVNGASLAWVFVTTDRGGTVGTKDTTPWSFTYVVPMDVTGSVTLGAVSSDTVTGDPYTASTVVQVGTGSATLTSMALHINTTLQGTWSKNMFFDYYMETQYVNVEGTYSDGVTRDLSSPASGTVYTPQDTSIVKVLPDGNLQAVGQGATTVTATNSGQSLTINVT
ncbi:MAG: hypothetical protein AAB263_19550, partial [Planctomycetota bacterium]